MLTRFIRIQLTIFTIASVIGVTAMTLTYIQLPTLVGIGHMTVTLQLPATGGLYRFSNVTLRGVQIGKVTTVELTDAGAQATLSLDSAAKIPADLQADVLSMSAVGEQFIDLKPRSDAPPYLHDGSVIALDDTTIPQQVGPMLDQVSALVGSIPKDRLGALVDEAFTGFNGADYDFGSLLDSGAKLTHDINGVADNARALIDDSGPLLDSQAQTVDSLRTWTHSLAGITGQLANDDPQVRTLLQKGPGFAQEASRLLEAVKPTLPVLLANLTAIGQIGITYQPSIQQLLVLLPPDVAYLQQLPKNPTGMPGFDFTFTIGDPNPCTVGFLPPSQWRSPADVTDVDTPDGLYCKLPQDSPTAVRGARNYPCMGHPGKRAPTVEICDSDDPYQPLALRQHIVGPYPLDPNLIAQGIPPDSRIDADDQIYGPAAGTPMPPGAAEAPPPPDLPPTGTPPPPSEPADTSGVPPGVATTPPADGPPAVPDEGLPAAAPASFDGGATGGPSVAVVQYDPRTGRYTTPDGHTFRQSDLVASATPKSWKDLLPT